MQRCKLELSIEIYTHYKAGHVQFEQCLKTSRQLRVN